MSEPQPRIIGTLTDTEGRQVTVGLRGSKVTLRTLGTRTGDAVELDGIQAEDFAQLFLGGCWQAMQERAVSGRA
jgi:hypothetical protein